MADGGDGFGPVFAGLVGAVEQRFDRIDAADLVISGEGAVDAQTALGRGVGRIAAVAAVAGKPCLVLAEVTDPPGRGGLEVQAIGPELADRTVALAEPARWLAVAERVASSRRG